MLAELWKESLLDAYLEYFKKTKKEFNTARYIYGSILFLIFAVGFLMIGKYVYLLLTPIAFFIGFKLPYFSLMSSKKQVDLVVSFLFPQFLQNFMALLPSSGNVYQTLKVTTEYMNDPIKSQLEVLVKKIEQSNDREHYLEFAEFIGSSESYMIMDMIYQFSEFGVKKESLDYLRNYIQGLDENKVNELINKKMVASEKYGYTGIFIGMFFVLGYTGVIFIHYFKYVMDALSVIG